MGDIWRKIFYCCGGVQNNKVDYDDVLADGEREAVADLLNFLENVSALEILSCLRVFREGILS